MKYIFLPILIFSSLGFASCSVDLNSKSPASNYLDRVEASSNTVTETRKVASFEGIDVSSAISVTVEDGNYNGQISVEAPDNIMNRITTEVKNGVLVMKINGTVNLKNSSIKIKFPHQKLRSFNLSGATNVTVLPTQKVEKMAVDLSGASNLKLDVVSNSISVDNSGASSMKISGNVQDLNISVSGASSFVGKELKAANVVVDSSGASSVRYVDENGLKTKVSTSGMSSIKRIN